jgi:hypothetical protein
VRYLFVIILLAGSIRAQNPREIIRKSLEVDARTNQRQDDYTYLMREETRSLGPNGETRHTTVKTVEISTIDGSSYERLVARDDKPLSIDEQKKEEAKLNLTIRDRSKETPAKRQRRIAEFRRSEEEERQPLKEVLDAFDFKLLGEETVEGALCWVIDVQPHAGYHPKTTASSALTALAGKTWVSKKDYGWVKSEMEARDSFSLGVFLVRLAKGAKVIIEQTDMGDGVWLPKLAEIRYSAKFLFFNAMHEDVTYTFIDYRKPMTHHGAAGESPEL